MSSSTSLTMRLERRRERFQDQAERSQIQRADPLRAVPPSPPRRSAPTRTSRAHRSDSERRPALIDLRHRERRQGVGGDDGGRGPRRRTRAADATDLREGRGRSDRGTRPAARAARSCGRRCTDHRRDDRGDRRRSSATRSTSASPVTTIGRSSLMRRSGTRASAGSEPISGARVRPARASARSRSVRLGGAGHDRHGLVHGVGLGGDDRDPPAEPVDVDAVGDLEDVRHVVADQDHRDAASRGP